MNAETHSCTQCGATYEGDNTCESRFNELLALDHSRREPWGSRHGLAFAVYALQHPSSFDKATLDRSWLILYRVFVAGNSAPMLLHALVKNPALAASIDVPPRPSISSTQHPRITIADLGNFEAIRYATRLQDWCVATLRWLGMTAPIVPRSQSEELSAS